MNLRHRGVSIVYQLKLPLNLGKSVGREKDVVHTLRDSTDFSRLKSS